MVADQHAQIGPMEVNESVQAVDIPCRCAAIFIGE